jgi:hypothetical protein
MNRYPSPEIETSVSRRGEVQEQPRRPTITFNVRVAVKQTIHRNDFTGEEKNRSWYKKADLLQQDEAIVLDKQERQWRVGYDNDEELRNVYLHHSSQCSHAAHIL